QIGAVRGKKLTVKKASPETAVLVNLPVCGAEQYAWGLRRSGNTAKGYRRNMLSAAKLLLERFDNRQEEGIYVSAPLLTIDPQNGFDTVTECVNAYSDVRQSHLSNWVHPSPAGYFQMGDAIAPVIAYCMQKSR
ncbi:MAG: hypothetical protein MJ078_03255, partial [Clostridia bacterium]|nr:hypothetical protein [Clostridia bacterium]